MPAPEIITAPDVSAELIQIIKEHGWNVDHKTAAPVLRIIMSRLRAFDEVGKMCARYLLDPEAFMIDSVPVEETEESEQ